MSQQGHVTMRRMDGPAAVQVQDAFRLIYAEAFAEPPHEARRGAADPVLAGVRVVVLTDYGLDVRCSRWWPRVLALPKLGEQVEEHDVASMPSRMGIFGRASTSRTRITRPAPGGVRPGR